MKTNLHNLILDEFLNYSVITYIEDDLFESVSNDDNLESLSKYQLSVRTILD